MGIQRPVWGVEGGRQLELESTSLDGRPPVVRTCWPARLRPSCASSVASSQRAWMTSRALSATCRCTAPEAVRRSPVRISPVTRAWCSRGPPGHFRAPFHTAPAILRTGRTVGRGNDGTACGTSLEVREQPGVDGEGQRPDLHAGARGQSALEAGPWMAVAARWHRWQLSTWHRWHWGGLHLFNGYIQTGRVEPARHDFRHGSMQTRVRARWTYCS